MTWNQKRHQCQNLIISLETFLNLLAIDSVCAAHCAAHSGQFRALRDTHSKKGYTLGPKVKATRRHFAKWPPSMPVLESLEMF